MRSQIQKGCVAHLVLFDFFDTWRAAEPQSWTYQHMVTFLSHSESDLFDWPLTMNLLVGLHEVLVLVSDDGMTGEKFGVYSSSQLGIQSCNQVLVTGLHLSMWPLKGPFIPQFWLVRKPSPVRDRVSKSHRIQDIHTGYHRFQVSWHKQCPDLLHKMVRNKYAAGKPMQSLAFSKGSLVLEQVFEFTEAVARLPASKLNGKDLSKVFSRLVWRVWLHVYIYIIYTYTYVHYIYNIV